MSRKDVQNGRRFTCSGGEIITVFTTGTLIVQGKTNTPLAAKVNALKPGGHKTAQVAVDNRIFIVYGHDISTREGLELMLRRMGLDPIVLQSLPAAGDTIIEKLERYIIEHGKVAYACVLLTPDDQGHIAGKPEEIKYRARQNVVLELGMVLAGLGRRRVAILIKESVEQPSDIAGLIYIPFKERVDEVRTQLFRELQEAGFKPDPKGL